MPDKKTSCNNVVARLCKDPYQEEAQCECYEPRAPDRGPIKYVKKHAVMGEAGFVSMCKHAVVVDKVHFCLWKPNPSD